jgi:CBS domain-containing protein
MVRDVMRTDFATVSPDESVASARQTMRLARLRHLVVTGEGALIGILSYRDLLEQLGDAPSSERVANAMKAPVTIAPETSLRDAADAMCRYGLGCLPVVTAGGALVGLITESDLLRAAYGLRPH